MKLNKIGEVWNSENRLLSDFFGLLSSKNFAAMETWRKRLLLSKVLRTAQSQKRACLLVVESRVLGIPSGIKNASTRALDESAPWKYETSVMYRISLRACFPIWASEPGLSSRVRAPRASTFHDIPEVESLLAG